MFSAETRLRVKIGRPVVKIIVFFSGFYCVHVVKYGLGRIYVLALMWNFRLSHNHLQHDNL